MSRSRSRSASPAPRDRSRSRSGSPVRDRDSRPSREAEAADGNKLFIGNIGFDMSEKDLEEMCDKYGKVMEARLAVDRFTRKPQGFAFITMETASDASKCVEGLDGKEVDGRPLTVQISHGKGGRKRELGDRRMDDARATGACFDFVSGRCSRGDSCKFKHIDSRGGRDRGSDRDRGYDRRDRYDDRRRSRSRSPRRDRDYGRDRDRDYDRRDRGGSRDNGRDRSRSRDRDYRR